MPCYLLFQSHPAPIPSPCEEWQCTYHSLISGTSPIQIQGGPQDGGTHGGGRLPLPPWLGGWGFGLQAQRLPGLIQVEGCGRLWMERRQGDEPADNVMFLTCDGHLCLITARLLMCVSLYFFTKYSTLTVIIRERVSDLAGGDHGPLCLCV